MREIKFRGKRLDNGEWVYGFYGRVQDDNSKYLHFIKEDTTLHQQNVRQVAWEVDPSTVGQFTGLLDKNGKEIYEGDIVANGMGISWEVKFGYCADRNFTGWFATPDNTRKPSPINNDADSDRNSVIEVIGTIHDKGKEVK